MTAFVEGVLRGLGVGSVYASAYRPLLVDKLAGLFGSLPGGAAAQSGHDNRSVREAVRQGGAPSVRAPLGAEACGARSAMTEMRQLLGRWTARKLATALALLLEAEMACKTTGMPAEAITARAMMRLVAAARA